MTIREAEEKDLPEIMNLIESAMSDIHQFGSFVSMTKRNVLPVQTMAEAWVKQRDLGATIVLEGDTGRLEGLFFAGDWKVPFDYDPGKAAHDLIAYISPEYRSKGCGKIMHDFVCASLKSKGFKVMFAGSFYENEKSTSILMSSGFKPYEMIFYKEL